MLVFAWLSSRNDQSKRRQLIDDVVLSLPPVLVTLFLRWLALRFDRPPQGAASA